MRLRVILMSNPPVWVDCVSLGFEGDRLVGVTDVGTRILWDVHAVFAIEIVDVRV